MSRVVRLFAVLMLLVGILPTQGAIAQPASDLPAGAGLAPAALLVENVGQWDAAARFQVWGGPGTTWLAHDAVWIALPEPASDSLTAEGRPVAAAPRAGVALRLSFDGANPAARIVPFGPSETVVSYLRGDDPAQWHAEVPVWTGARYVDLYPGLDLEIYTIAGSWAWRMVAKGVGTSYMMSLQNVRLRVEGAEQVTLEGAAVRVETAIGAVSLPLLQAVDASGAALTLPAGGPQVGAAGVVAPFAVPEESAITPAGVDSLVFSTFLGGADYDLAYGVAVDALGRTFVAGAASVGFPTTSGAYDVTQGGDVDVFVSLLNATGTRLVYSTFLGGSGEDEALCLAVDVLGRAYVAGHTGSSEFPTTAGAFDTDYGGSRDGFVAVLSAAGSRLVYSTFLGGSGADDIRGIALDAAGRAYVGGKTTSSSFPTTGGAFQTAYGGGQADAFVSVLDPAGSALVYSTYIGGSGQDEGNALALDGAGRAYLTGITNASDYPTTTGAYDTSFGGDTDAFVSALDATGSSLIYSTYVGSYSNEWCYGIAVDDTGRAYITGSTLSSDYPTTANAYDTVHNGYYDVFVTALSDDGTALVSSTFIGGGDYDAGHAIAVDDGGWVYVTGLTNGSAYPVTADAHDTSSNGDFDAFLSVLNAQGSVLVYSTYLGGEYDESGSAVAVDETRRAYVAGYTYSTDYPGTVGAYRASHNGYCDAFVSAVQTSSPGTHFAPASEWWGGLKDWAPQNRYPRMTGDVNGDGIDDVVAFNPVSGAWVALSTGSALAKPVNWTSEFAWLQASRNPRVLGDMNGDGLDDIVGFRPDEGDSGKVYLALSTGSSFAPATVWMEGLVAAATLPRLLGDVNGDGLDDLVVVDYMGAIAVWTSNGSGFDMGREWSTESGWMSDDRNWVALGDVNGDGYEDLVNFRYGEGIYVALSGGTSFGARTLWGAWLKYWGPDTRNPRLVGDVTGDGLDDVVAYDPDRGGFVAVSTGTSFDRPAQWTTDFAIRPNNYNLHALGDMNGDGRVDALCFIYGDGVFVGLSRSE